jgi:hypothetical protein
MFLPVAAWRAGRGGGNSPRMGMTFSAAPRRTPPLPLPPPLVCTTLPAGGVFMQAEGLLSVLYRATYVRHKTEITTDWVRATLCWPACPLPRCAEWWRLAHGEGFPFVDWVEVDRSSPRSWADAAPRLKASTCTRTSASPPTTDSRVENQEPQSRNRSPRDTIVHGPKRDVF